MAGEFSSHLDRCHARRQICGDCIDVAKLEQGETVGRINDDVKNLIPRCRCRFRIGIRIRWKKESYIYLSFLPLKFSEKLVTNRLAPIFWKAMTF